MSELDFSIEQFFESLPTDLASLEHRNNIMKGTLIDVLFLVEDPVIRQIGLKAIRQLQENGTPDLDCVLLELGITDEGDK